MTQAFEEMNEYVEQRYKDAIAYYWKASRTNKKGYKYTRSLTVILGALVTLTASASAGQYTGNWDFMNVLLKILTPILAASLTIIAGFSQSFQWGATWKDMVMTAQLLEKERDRFLVTKLEDRDLVRELEILNNFVLRESQNFFNRLIGSSKGEEDDAPEVLVKSQETAVSIVTDEDEE